MIVMVMMVVIVMVMVVGDDYGVGGGMVSR